MQAEIWVFAADNTGNLINKAAFTLSVFREEKETRVSYRAGNFISNLYDFLTAEEQSSEEFPYKATKITMEKMSRKINNNW